MCFWISATRFQKLSLPMACAERLLDLSSDDEESEGENIE